MAFELISSKARCKSCATTAALPLDVYVYVSASFVVLLRDPTLQSGATDPAGVQPQSCKWFLHSVVYMQALPGEVSSNANSKQTATSQKNLSAC